MNMSGTRYRASLIGGLLLLAIAVLVASCGGGDSEAGSPNEDLGGIIVTLTPGQATALPRRTSTPSAAPTPSPLQVCAPNPDPAPPKQLQIMEPHPEQQVKIPFHVRGWGSNIGQDNRGVALGIVDSNQKVVQVLNLPPQPNTYRLPPPGLDRTEHTRPFGADIVIQGVTAPTPYCLWIYQSTTADGRPRGVVQFPIVVVP
jgi:hypothetical protein